ncbi:ATP-dependent helicase HrpB, partial [Meiothermus sp. PNK-Is4]
MPAQPLPIHEALPDLKKALARHPTVILQAPPGAGKSTVLPLELLNEPWLGGRKILMLEPRRLAARAVAARLAALLGEEVGQTVGYRVRFESRVGRQTRLEVLTEGILTRRLQHDPTLEGVGLVIFDEFHERSLQADLGLALTREVQGALREDLRLLVMSATLDGESLSRALGKAPVVTAQGRQYPVELHYLSRDPEGHLIATAAGAVARALERHEGDVLVFLPGVGEILRGEKLLKERHPELRVLPLYGDLPLPAQQEAILPDPAGRRKVVLATSVAETSLTIEGVRVVVDSGFSRLPRFDARSGLTRLETVRVTRDSADQRAGRAGRLGPGACYRLWSPATQAALLPQRRPEILEADLASLVLELAQWGVRDVYALAWVTPPPVGALRQARALLEELGALEGDTLTERGRQMLEWPTHPR